ncbi:n-acetylglucosamine-1-phosphotransferase subunit gamma [Trichonephila inaurata madagascariensis]|uniref:N-acetylglucosamine-1-phosphotransferase subunit gamma n=2 Tax=Trichonephila inaurata madagascariensis TaxID=2747483 RepID=A0A8X6IBL2_9ARAC|nr:n-acetylglucosamine-1-phosphotransferase subunit gamma [Trichonephila inaurata madagascariensis]
MFEHWKISKRHICGYFFFSYLLLAVASATVVQMRVVKETANYGYFGSNVGDNENSNQLIPTVPPANFSGPELLHRLVGKCYNLTQDRYRYTFCPFQNFTQYEISPRWNAYQGILGIWSHWDIQNNTFAAMVLKNGDHCGDIDRSSKITLKCGPNETLLNVTEPSRCEYSAQFSTRYVCHKDALLVYPRLNSELQVEWDHLHTDFHYGDITEKGYLAGLQKIFQKAGLAEISTPKPTETSTTATTFRNGGIFSDLQTCNKEYKNLQNEISKLNMELEAMKLMIDLSKIQNRTNKPRLTSHE